MAGHEVAAGLHREVGEVDPPAHDPQLVGILHPAEVLDNIVSIDKAGVGRAQTQLLETAFGRLFNTDAGPIKATMSYAFRDPAHPVHGPGVVEVRFVIFYPPQLDLIGFQLRNEQRRVARFGNKGGQGAFGGEVKITGGVDDIDRMQQKQRVESTLVELALYLCDFAPIPIRLQAIVLGWWSGGRHPEHTRASEQASAGGQDHASGNGTQEIAAYNAAGGLILCHVPPPQRGLSLENGDYTGQRRGFKSQGGKLLVLAGAQRMGSAAKSKPRARQPARGLGAMPKPCYLLALACRLAWLTAAMKVCAERGTFTLPVSTRLAGRTLPYISRMESSSGAMTAPSRSTPA